MTLKQQLVASLYLTRVEQAIAKASTSRKQSDLRAADALMQDRKQFEALPLESRMQLRQQFAAAAQRTFQVVQA